MKCCKRLNAGCFFVALVAVILMLPSAASAKKFFCELSVETDRGTRTFSDTWDFKVESSDEAEAEFFSPNNCHRVCGEKIEWPKHGNYHFTKCSQKCMDSGTVTCREAGSKPSKPPVKPALVGAKQNKTNRPMLYSYSSWVGNSAKSKSSNNNSLYISKHGTKKKSLLIK